MICRDGLVRTAAQTISTNSLKPPLQTLCDVVSWTSSLGLTGDALSNHTEILHYESSLALACCTEAPMTTGSAQDSVKIMEILVNATGTKQSDPKKRQSSTVPSYYYRSNVPSYFTTENIHFCCFILFYFFARKWPNYIEIRIFHC